MSDELLKFVQILDFEELRGCRPADFVFLCGGYAEDSANPPYVSLRHYLLRHSAFVKKIKGYLVLAEDAQKIFDDNYYDDLISFEEDIARAASLIAIIAESAGSLAELGAFASILQLSRRTCVIQQKEFEAQRSFITLGPVKRMLNSYPESVAYFPWRKNTSKVFHTTCRPHVTEIVSYINGRLALSDSTLKLSLDSDLELLYVTLWVIFLVREISTQRLYDTVRMIKKDATDKQIKSKLFTLIVSKWIGVEPYSGKKYYYYRFDSDPLIYRFKDPGHRADQYKLELIASLKRAEVIPNHVKVVGRNARLENKK